MSFDALDRVAKESGAGGRAGGSRRGRKVDGGWEIRESRESCEILSPNRHVLVRAPQEKVVNNVNKKDRQEKNSLIM